MLQFERLANELLCEILSHLPVEDIIRSRQVCRRLQGATLQRVVWANAYRNLDLLKPEGPMPTQTAQDLEDLLVCAAKIQRMWHSHSDGPRVSSKVFEGLQGQEYDATMISGRYLMVGTLHEIFWYDLDQGGRERLDIPIATYEVGGTMSIGMQRPSAQVNANSEGPDTAY